MTASTTAGTASEPRTYSEKQGGLFGLWLFIASEAFLFSAFIAARFYYLYAPEKVTRPDELNQALGLGLAILLLVSSITAFRAEALWRYGDKKSSLTHLVITMVLGVVFLVGVGFEWAEGFHSLPVGGEDPIFASLFYTITGFHAFHVITGIIALGFAWNMGRNGKLDAPDNWAVEGTVKYWHFVDVAWVFIYPALYLVN